MDAEKALVFSAPLSQTRDSLKGKTREEKLMAEMAKLVHDRWVKALTEQNLCYKEEGDCTPEAYAEKLANNYDARRRYANRGF